MSNGKSNNFFCTESFPQRLGSQPFQWEYKSTTFFVTKQNRGQCQVAFSAKTKNNVRLLFSQNILGEVSKVIARIIVLTINWPDSFHLGSVALVNFVVCLRIMILVEGNVTGSSTSLSAVTVPLTYLIIIHTVLMLYLFDRAVCTKVCF